MEFKLGQMVLYMRAIGIKTRQMAKANLFMRMATFMKAVGRMERLTVMVFSSTIPVVDIKDTG